MKKTIWMMIPVFFLLTVTPIPAQAANNDVAGASALPKDRFIEKKIDPRITKLQTFLELKKSPLADYAADFIQTADKYGLSDYDLDYLVPAITGLESSFGKHYPQGSYNAYGWASGNYNFASWEASIDHVTRVLRQKYIDRGANTIYKIGPIYAESPTWAQRVSSIFSQIENFTSNDSRVVLNL